MDTPQNDDEGKLDRLRREISLEIDDFESTVKEATSSLDEALTSDVIDRLATVIRSRTNDQLQSGVDLRNAGDDGQVDPKNDWG